MNFKLENLKIKAQSFLDHEYDEHKKQEIQQKVRDTEEQWIRLQKDAKEVMVLAERQRALDSQLQDFEATREKTRTWLEEKQQSLVFLSSQKDPEQIISTAQVSLDNKKFGEDIYDTQDADIKCMYIVWLKIRLKYLICKIPLSLNPSFEHFKMFLLVLLMVIFITNKNLFLKEFCFVFLHSQSLPCFIFTACLYAYFACQ